MDVDKYLPLFLAEAREHLQELNLAVVRIEEDPADKETVATIFRIAHSLKGTSATMGFAGMAAVTHEMEEVFELLRQRSGGLSRDAINVLFECLDALAAAVEHVEADGDEAIDHEPLVERLSALVRADDVEADEPATATTLDEQAALTAADGRRALRVTVRLADETAMAGVRAYMVVDAVRRHGEVVAAAPDDDALDGFAGRLVECVVVTDDAAEVVQASAIQVPDVATAEAHVLMAVAADKGSGEPARESAAQSGRRGSATVRVDADRLDLLMHHMGELVVQRTHVESLVGQASVPGLSQAMQDLIRCSQSLQAMVMQVRMVPVEAVFLRFPRLVRDLSNRLGKNVELELVGQDTELDRTVVDALGDPLVHLVRNALDHGLETPGERTAAGKPAQGTLEIAARHAGGNVVITVRDDGRGIDAAHVAAKAVERGLIDASEAAEVDAARAAELLFEPGFSTADTASDISGRGVGMDAVRNAIRGLGGDAILESEPGQGTCATIRLPLTLAIVSTLLVEAGEASYAIPLERVERTLDLAEHTVRSVAGRDVLVLPEGVLPLYDAAGALGDAPATGMRHAVVVRGAGRRLALSVGRLVGQRELVTRPLPPRLASRAAVSGGAVLATGDIALIVDCDALAAEPLSAAA